MMGDANPRVTKVKQRRLSRRDLWTLATVVVFAVAGVALTWHYLTHPPRPWLVRWKLDRYLKSESHASNFKVDFPFPSKAEMAAPKTKATEAPPKVGSRTGKSFEALREEYLSKKTAATALER